MHMQIYIIKLPLFKILSTFIHGKAAGIIGLTDDSLFLVWPYGSNMSAM